MKKLALPLLLTCDTVAFAQQAAPASSARTVAIVPRPGQAENVGQGCERHLN